MKTWIEALTRLLKEDITSDNFKCTDLEIQAIQQSYSNDQYPHVMLHYGDNSVAICFDGERIVSCEELTYDESMLYMTFHMKENTKIFRSFGDNMYNMDTDIYWPLAAFALHQSMAYKKLKVPEQWGIKHIDIKFPKKVHTDIRDMFMRDKLHSPPILFVNEDAYGYSLFEQKGGEFVYYPNVKDQFHEFPTIYGEKKMAEYVIQYVGNVPLTRETVKQTYFGIIRDLKTMDKKRVFSKYHVTSRSQAEE